MAIFDKIDADIFIGGPRSESNHISRPKFKVNPTSPKFYWILHKIRLGNDWQTYRQPFFLLLITVTIVFGLVIWIGKVVINHTFKRYKLHSMLTTNRTNTIHALTLNIFRYTCFFSFTFMQFFH